MNRIRVLLLLFLFCGRPVHAASSLTTQEVEEALTCQCSCGLTVHSCNHLQCGFAVPAKEQIAAQVRAGKSKEEILTDFVGRYGEKVLSAPTTSGFNLAAWITPFLALIVGGVAVGIVSLRWSRKRSHEEKEPEEITGETAQYRERLKKELEKFDI